jgi:hypothetical protein
VEKRVEVPVVVEKTRTVVVERPVVVEKTRTIVVEKRVPVIVASGPTNEECVLHEAAHILAKRRMQSYFNR